MRFSDLPDDVLYDVLRWAFNYDIDMLHEFKRNLPLLAVCQRWRHAALPMVYSTTAVRFMRSVTSEWGGVKSLVLKLGPPGQLSDEPDSNIEAACDAIAAVFPAVSELCFSAGIFGRDAVAGKIYGGLAGLYAGQLERLEVEHPVDIPREVVLKRLKHMWRLHLPSLEWLERLEIDIPFGANNDVTALPVANHILSNVRASKQAALIFRNSVSLSRD
ncbi:hypothetical protein H4R18_003926 [Coemansia javaensis]|uniref:F-box domain-containing protein n=1 Tax=Coemansia javaensis TaxID=2761396 RepID=A0A9W8H6C4_9FUNG|nr:hypothetical protein H4R18_003926 [Coemansia javaensis]